MIYSPREALVEVPLWKALRESLLDGVACHAFNDQTESYNIERIKLQYE